MRIILFMMLCFYVAQANVSTEVLLQKLGDKQVAILDTRSEDAYNGWKLNNEARSGHIKNAIPFPASWTKVLDKESAYVKSLLEKKEVILYGANKQSVVAVYNFLQAAGLKKLFIYEDGIHAYAKQKNLPMQALARFEKLVPASYVKKKLGAKNFKVFEVSWGKGDAYAKAHIPSAVHVNTDEIEKAPVWNYKQKSDLVAFLKRYGISSQTQVVLYGPDSMPASRLAVMLMSFGIKDVRLLNGGFEAWKSAGYEVEKGFNKASEQDNVSYKDENTYISSMADVKGFQKNKAVQLVSIRSHAEHMGETSGYSYIKARGEIKGALWGKAGSDAYHLEDYRSVSGKMRHASALKKMWQDLGINTDKKLVFYCGTGWRAAEVLFYAYVMGYNNISLFDGGWLEYSLDKSNEVVIKSQ